MSAGIGLPPETLNGHPVTLWIAEHRPTDTSHGRPTQGAIVVDRGAECDDLLDASRGGRYVSAWYVVGDRHWSSGEYHPNDRDAYRDALDRVSRRGRG